MKTPLAPFAAFAALLALTGCGDDETTKLEAASEPAVAVKREAPGGDWTQLVNKTAAGGYMLGNPDAPVKLIEYASLTCPACANFHKTGYPELIDKYVKSGQVAFELRNFVRDPADVAAALLSRCAAPEAYFKLTDQLFEDQPNWFDRFAAIPQDEATRISQLPPQQQAVAFARAGGLDQFVRVRGIPQERAESCLTDEGMLNQLLRLNQIGIEQHDVTGTPTFVLDGEKVETAAGWAQLEPEIQKALD